MKSGAENINLDLALSKEFGCHPKPDQRGKERGRKIFCQMGKKDRGDANRLKEKTKKTRKKFGRLKIRKSSGQVK